MISNGIDLVKVDRINDKLCNKVFNENELKYINESSITAAGMFAAKEALLKAIKKGIDSYSLKDIEISHDNKAPFFTFHGELDYLNDYDISVSISHDGEYAVAVASIINIFR